MNLEFLQIGIFMGRDVAYFFDRDSGTVVRFPVEDRTGYQRNESNRSRSIQIPNRDMEDDYVPPRSPQLPTNLPDKPVSIMPPGMVDLMRPDIAP